MIIDFEPLLDSDEAAQLLEIHPKTLQRMEQRGEIPGVQIGQQLRFRRSDPAIPGTRSLLDPSNWGPNHQIAPGDHEEVLNRLSICHLHLAVASSFAPTSRARFDHHARSLKAQSVCLVRIILFLQARTRTLAKV